MTPDYFFALADRLNAGLHGNEMLLCHLHGESSDFIRLNHNRVRQAGRVTQHHLHLDLIAGARHAAATLTLTGVAAQDESRAREAIGKLRMQCDVVPEDPHLLYATEVHNTLTEGRNHLPDSGAALEQIHDCARGLDLVGLWASGTLATGFANSLGQRNWHASATFNFDWSCYHATDKAVKCNYAGFDWDAAELQRRMSDARAQLEIMARPARTLAPGTYRVYLAPAALEELLGMLSWGGFGLKSHRTAHTPLLKMIREGSTLHAAVNLREDHARSLAPPFTRAGFVVTAPVTLIEHGRFKDCLVSPRSAKEYGVPLNSGGEAPLALDVAAGTLARERVVEMLDTGLYVNNLWYCNFSDRDDCRITGMTRFACFWVEHGRVQAPVNVMRFDDSMYRVLGDRLLGLTREREFLFDTSTYQQRSTRSARLPGALVEALTLTL